MSRMHSRRRGSSGSTRPVNANTDWVIYDEGEVQDLVQKLADQGLEPSAIGRRLRDRYGIPDVRDITGTSITGITGGDEEFPEDLRNLMQEAIRIQDHLEEHPNDLSAERQLALTESKIRRLVDYYQGDEIPADWTYNIEKARLIVE